MDPYLSQKNTDLSQKNTGLTQKNTGLTQKNTGQFNPLVITNMADSEQEQDKRQKKNSPEAKLTEAKTTHPVGLISKNLMIKGKRTSIRLEPSMWDALEEICVRERCSIHQICGLVSSRLNCSSFTAAVRVFTLSYYRVAATEHGHAAAGHGQLTQMRWKSNSNDRHL